MRVLPHILLGATPARSRTAWAQRLGGSEAAPAPVGPSIEESAAAVGTSPTAASASPVGP